MNDTQIIDTLADRPGGYKQLAAELAVTRQTIWDWRRKGISHLGRFLISRYAKERRVKLPKDFMERDNDR